MVKSLFHASCWFAVFYLAAPTLPAADGPARGRPIEFSEPRDERGATNVRSLLPGRTTLLEQLEADINRPFKSIVPGGSLNGMMMTDPGPVPTPALPSARVREIMSRKQDRMYLTPEELLLPKSIEEIYKAPELTPDGRSMKSLRPMEREIMKTLNTDRMRLMTNQSGSMFGPNYANSGGSMFSAPNAANAAYGTTTAPDKNLRNLLGMEGDSSAARAREARDSQELFGLGDANGRFGNKLSASELQRRDAVMQLYNPNYTPPVDGAAPSPGLFATPYVDSTFYDPPKPVANPSASGLPLNSANPVSAAPAYTPSYTPPSAPIVQPAPAPAPASPFMSLPKRNF